MTLSAPQLAMLKRVEPGLVWYWFISPEDDEALRSLIDAGLVRSREDIASHLLMLSQSGIAALESSREQAAQRAERAAEKEYTKNSTRFSNIVSLLALLVSLASLLLTVLRD